MPTVKKFVKEPGHADSYEELEIKYIPGHPPELVCFVGVTEKERVSLADMSVAKLHVMMEDRGLKRRQGAREDL